jgi:hypothetical protein
MRRTDVVYPQRHGEGDAVGETSYLHLAVADRDDLEPGRPIRRIPGADLDR